VPPRLGYCLPDDLLYGNIPLPTWITREQVIGAAADEIDSYLGYIYEVPVETPPGSNAEKPIPAVVGLTLKRINAALASGRLILQLDSAGENAKLHAYGLSLVQEALGALKCIQDGEIVLPNVPPSNPEEPVVTGPMIANVDPESNVEAFYNRIANPHYVFPGGNLYANGIPSGDGYIAPGSGGLVRP
jgi:hypothetical protein